MKEENKVNITVEPNQEPVRHSWGQQGMGLDPSPKKLRKAVVNGDGAFENEIEEPEMYGSDDIEV